MRVPIRFWNPEQANGSVDVDSAMVDTGATWTCVSRDIANRLELRTVGYIDVRTAGGPRTLEQSYALIELEGKRMVSPLLISDELSGVLIGVTTLESLGFIVDPTKEELREAEVFLL